MTDRLFAITYHPMYLLADEDRGDPPILERQLPWGAPDAETYIARIERNLGALRDHADLVLNYEFSGRELEALAERRPDIIAQMQALIATHQLEFVGGDYAQAHLHVLGAESSLRQLLVGQAVFREILGESCPVFFHQETGVYPQLPQILQQLGVSHAVAPVFPWHATVLNAGFEFGSWTDDRYDLRYRLPRDMTLARWVGPDGTALPLYLQSQLRVNPEDVARDAQRGLLRAAPLWIKCPDMEELTDTEYHWMAEAGRFVRLRDGLAALPWQESTAPALELYSYWSYVEGMGGERLLQALTATEGALIMAEALVAMAMVEDPRPATTHASAQLTALWKEFLGTQHHDIMWVETTDLKEKALRTLDHIGRAAAETTAMIMGNPAQPGTPGTATAVFNPFPYPVPWVVPPTALDGPETRVPATLVTAPALGFATPSDEPASPETWPLQPGHWTVRADATLSWSRPDGLTRLQQLGLMRFTRPNGRVVPVNATLRQDPPEDARHANFSGVADGVAVRVHYRLLQDGLGAVVDYSWTFDQDAIGDMWDDTSKLLIDWAGSGPQTIRYDVPFGVAEARPDRPIHATSWVALEVDGGTVHVIHDGHPKFLVGPEGGLSSVIAWGSHTFTNRMDTRFTRAQQFDLRLTGTVHTRFVLLSLASGAPAAALSRIAQGIRLQTLAPGPVHRWEALRQRVRTTLGPLASGLVCTSTTEHHGGLQFRVVNMGAPVTPEAAFPARVPSAQVTFASLGGAPLTLLDSWRIAHIQVRDLENV